MGTEGASDLAIELLIPYGAEDLLRPSRGRWTVAAVPAQGTRAALLAATRAAALLQRRVPEGGAGLVAVEGPGEIPGHRDRQTETQRAKPALSGARQEPKTAGRRSRSRRREGNPYRVFLTPVVTGPAGTRGSVRRRAGRGGAASGNGAAS